MSKQIDERIVEMQFDNKQFEQGVSTTIKSLDKLKDSLNFEDSVKGFDKLDKAAKNTDVSALGKAAENVKEKFSALGEIAIGALRRIGEQALSAAENLIKSMSGIEAALAGFQRYEELTQTTQTMIAATRSQFNDTGTQMEFVNGELEKMMWFADETSYKITDLTSATAKFYGAGADIEETTSAILGIANAAALAGVNSQDASRAYMNLSQAMGTGALRLQDWKSLELLNMTTVEWCQTLIDTGLALGKLTTDKDGLPYIMENGKKIAVTTANIRDTLKTGWVDNDVLMGTLQVYGDFSEKMYQYTQDTGIYTTQLLDYAQQYADGILDWEEVYKNLPEDIRSDQVNKVIRDIHLYEEWCPS